MSSRRFGFAAQNRVIAAGFLVLLAMSAVSLWLIHESNAASRGAAASLETLNLLANARGDLRRAESNQRGYLLTAESQYLEDYEATRRRVLPAIDALAELTAGDPAQAANVQALRDVVEQKLAELAEAVAQWQAGRRDETERQIASPARLELMDRFVTLVDEASDHEQERLDALFRSSSRIELTLFAVNGLGGVLVLALAGLSLLLFRRRARELIAAQDALEAANRRLEARVAERTAHLRQANEEIQRFAYVVSHDLRAPLVNIMGFTGEIEALRDQLLAQPSSIAPPEQAGRIANPDTLRRDLDEALHFIKTSIEKMDRLINAILKLSRAGRREFSAQTVDLNRLAAGVAANFAHRAQQAGIDIQVDPLPTIVSDPLALEQILSNLLDNAVKYLRNDVPGRVRISATEEGEYVSLSVADNGRGIAESDQERVFDLFRRAGPQDQAGEGIGLAYARILARRIGGTIRLHSVLNEGSTFTLTLPRAWTF